MSSSKPYYTTDALVEAVELTMSFPISQNSYTYNDIVKFLNQEMMLNAVPTIMQERQEYFVHRRPTSLINNIGRYPISERAIAMSLRDLKYVDTNGNFYDMARTAPDDKAFQQVSTNNGVVGRFYLEGNDIVLVDSQFEQATGELMQFFYLRPNNLVRDDRACIIQGFRKRLSVLDNSSFVVGNSISVTINGQSTAPQSYSVTLVSGSPGSGEFILGVDEKATADNIASALNALAGSTIATTTAATLTTPVYLDIASTNIALTVTTTASSLALDPYTNYMDILFDQLPSSYTDPVTDQTSSLYSAGGLVDFLQTKPGHRTHTYDVTLIAIDGNYGKFSVSELQTYAFNSAGGNKTFYPIVVGDYICLQYECIIPQIPPELHHALAERAASRIMMGSGDREGYAISSAKIKEMDMKQATLIGDRVESSPVKVFNRYSILRSNKLGSRRRY